MNKSLQEKGIGSNNFFTTKFISNYRYYKLMNTFTSFIKENQRVKTTKVSFQPQLVLILVLICD